MTNRKASLIAPASFANAFATSGASSTKFVPARYRAAYLPRTPPLSSWRRSYSGRNSSFISSVNFFFIGFSFSWGQCPCANDPNPLATLGMGHHQKTGALRQANNDVTVLGLGVVGIRHGSTERISEDRCGFAERDLVFANVLRFLFGVAVKFHTASVASLSSFAHPG